MTVFYGKKTLPPNKRGELIPLPPFIDKRPVDYLPNLEEKIQRKNFRLCIHLSPNGPVSPRLRPLGFCDAAQYMPGVWFLSEVTIISLQN
jgi:hypothetical protein